MTPEGYQQAGILACQSAYDGAGQINGREFVAAKHSQEARTNTASSLEDRDLKVFIRRDRSYTIELGFTGLMYAASDLRFSLTGPAAVIIQGQYTYRSPDMPVPASTGFYDALPVTSLSSADNGAFEIFMRMTIVDPATDGFLKLNWAQVTATSDVTRVWGGSYIKMIEEKAV